MINRIRIGHKILVDVKRQKVDNIDKKALNHIACTDIGDNILPNSQCITPTREIINKVKKYTDRKIIIHNKFSKEPLENLLRDAWAFVSLQSTAGFMAMSRGIPSYFTEKTLSHIGKIENIENPIIDYKIFNNL